MTTPAPIRSLEDVMEVVGSIEDLHPVDEWRVGSVDVWPIARVALGFALFRSIEGADARKPATDARRLLHRVHMVGRTIRRAGHGGWRPLPGAPIAFLADGRSYLETPDGLFDRHCDPLRLRLAEEGVPTSLLVPEPVGPMSVDGARSVRLALDAAVARSRLRRPPDAHLPGHEDAAAHLHAAGLSGVLPGRGALVRRASDVIAMAGEFERRLRALGARLALVSEYYSGTGMAFVLAARRSGLPSVDIQHGVQGPLHFAYASWRRLPSAGSALLPDRFWVWSSAEAECIARWAPEGVERSIIGGNAFLEASVRGELPGSAEATRSLDELMRSRRATRLVLVALNGHEPDEFVQMVLDAASRSGSGSLWAVRSHPTLPDGRRWAARARERRVDCVETELSSALPLFTLLGRARAVVTRLSSVTIDAESVGVPTVIADPLGVGLFADQIASGSAVVATSGADSLLKALGELPPVVPPSRRGAPGRAGVLELQRLAGEPI